MPLRLRPGVEVVRLSPRQFLLIHAASGRQLELGAEERYLLHLLGKGASLDDVLRQHARRFRRGLERFQLLEFVEQLGQLDLLDREEKPAPVQATPRPVKATAPAPAPLSRGDSKAAVNVVFDWLVLWFGWMVHPVWVIPILLLTVPATWEVVRNWQRFQSDMHSPWNKIAPLPLALGLLTQTVIFVNFPRALFTGVACRRFGGRVQGFGFTFWNGLVPTFYCELGDSLALMSSRGRWTVLSVNVWVQVAIGSASALLWVFCKPGSVASIFWLWLVPPCLLGLIINAAPFFEFSGYFLLCYAVDELNLRQRALAETDAWLTGRRAPEALTRRQRYWFRYYGVSYLLFRLVFDPVMILFCGFWMVQHFHGAGFLVFMIALLWWYSDSIGRILMHNETIQTLLLWGGYLCGGIAVLSGFAGLIPWVARCGGSWWVRWPIRLVLVLVGLTAVAFTPYNYEIAGECRLVPLHQYGARSQLPDEIVQVYVTEGSYVQPGDLLARLSGRQVKANILTTEAELRRAEASLDLLLTGHLTEQVHVAMDKVESAKATFDHAEIELQRTRVLVRDHAASDEELAKKQAARDTAKERLDAARENLSKLQEGYRDEKVRAQEAEIKKLEEKLNFYNLQLTLLEIRTPIGGYVNTPYMEQRQGQHVQPGDLVATVQDTSKLLVEVAADDAAAMDLSEGMVVHVRLYGMWGRLLTGKVRYVTLTSESDGKFGNAPVRTDKEMYQEQQVNTRTRDGGYHVRVYVELDEMPTNLSPEMTGYARIVVDEDDVLWRSLARPVVRFLRTEVWYWLP
jgi:multidrug resistance efflux pump